MLTLYHFPPSGPSRAALLVSRLIGIDIDIRILDLKKKEQLNSDFVKINPQHTVPTLVDGDFVLWDSHAIATYLANAYSKNRKFYPKEPKYKAIIDQRLNFDCGTLYPRIRAICFPVLWMGEDTIYEEDKTKLEEALGFLDVFIGDNNFVAGNDLTIADCSLVASVSSIVSVGWNIEAYGNVQRWLSKCSLEIPDYYNSNQVGADLFGKMVRSKLAPGQI